ncbi:MAG: DUF2207 domain-containing protein [Hyphomonas oceanitis]|uniref:DUF2207 domain-containing protein n=1 Tax=Hyphomonas oceanitis TaxID=81033 RepID=UPI003002D97B
MMGIRRFLLGLMAALFVLTATAEERINRFDVAINVERDGDIVVSETLDVTAEGYQIQRGIFRLLPRYYEDEGAKLPFDYKILSVTRDGVREPYETSTDGNAMQLRIGDANTYLENGEHIYEIRYRVKNQVRYFDDMDEFYWNATGNYWDFPIDVADVTITFPEGVQVKEHASYTGAVGAAHSDSSYRDEGNVQRFTTTRPLQPGQGLTVTVGIEKGLIDPPSNADETRRWWQRNGALAILIASLLGVFWFSWRNFNRVGRDPVKGPVFPHYAPPEDYSPAAVHYIYNRGLSGHKALIATLMNLAVKGHLIIDAGKDKVTTLTRTETRQKSATLAAEDLNLEAGLFGAQATRMLGKVTDPAFLKTYTKFTSTLERKYGDTYFRWNIGYTIIAILLSGGAITLAVLQATQWSWWHMGLVIGIIALNGWFMYLMPAPTKLGQNVRTEIEGFKLYMETAEKLQLNAVEVGSEAPPPMTAERYETFLPYAIALDVEKPWTKHFEKLMPEAAKAYNPVWTNMAANGFSDVGHMTSGMVSSISSGVTSSMPQSSSSSGSGGGGFSGGGGGGGGGGGW